MRRYYIQYNFNGTVRYKVFDSPAKAGQFAQYISTISGVTDVSRVIEAV